MFRQVAVAPIGLIRPMYVYSFMLQLYKICVFELKVLLHVSSMLFVNYTALNRSVSSHELVCLCDKNWVRNPLVLPRNFNKIAPNPPSLSLNHQHITVEPWPGTCAFNRLPQAPRSDFSQLRWRAQHRPCLTLALYTHTGLQLFSAWLLSWPCSDEVSAFRV